MMDQRKPDLDLEEMARTHHPPPPVPRERMWARIDAARAGRRGLRQPGAAPRPQPAWRIVRLAAGLAAVLMLGVSIGRISREPAVIPASGFVANAAGVAIDKTTQYEVYRRTAADLFGRADFLLTDFKVRTCDREDLSAVPTWAESMLVQTRLLMDTPVDDDPGMHALLQELEMVLAQIVGLSPEHCARDMAWIRRGLQERATIDRLRMMSAGDRI